ncbi:MAG: hypothetical protein R6V49_02185 [Bacteroidales bacterium]
MNGRRLVGYCTALVLLLLISLQFACDKEGKEQVPNVYVNFMIDIGTGQYTELQLIGGWVYVVGGYRGIILRRNSLEEIVALDRTSTYKPETLGNQVVVGSDNLTAVDTAGGMKYLLMDGTVIEGPVSTPLKRYRTTFNGNTLHVYN